MRTSAREWLDAARSTPFVPAPAAKFAINNYAAGVKGAYPRVGIFCGGIPFFMPQKTQKNPQKRR